MRLAMMLLALALPGTAAGQATLKAPARTCTVTD